MVNEILAETADTTENGNAFYKPRFSAKVYFMTLVGMTGKKEENVRVSFPLCVGGGPFQLSMRILRKVRMT